MNSKVLLLVLAAFGPAAASRLAASKVQVLGSNLRAGMRPEIVAKSLAKVEDEWKAQFRLYVECNATANSQDEAKKCSAAPKAFERSCDTIVSAVVKASNGDHSVVREYMDDICAEPELKGWRQGRCKMLSATVLSGMSEDSYDNRETLNSQPLCQSFWQRFSAEEQQLLKQETAEREALEKKQEEERAAEEKKMAEERAEEEKRMKQEEAAEAKQRAEEEEARRKQEEELKRQAEASAAKLQVEQQAEAEAEKKAEAEAEKQAEEAKKVEEATAKSTANATATPTVVMANSTAVVATNASVNETKAAVSNATTVNKTK